MLLIIAGFFPLIYNHLQDLNQGKNTVVVGVTYCFDVFGALCSSGMQQSSFTLTSNSEGQFYHSNTDCWSKMDSAYVIFLGFWGFLCVFKDSELHSGASNWDLNTIPCSTARYASSKYIASKKSKECS